MNDKKKDMKGLLIYLAFTFGITWSILGLFIVSNYEFLDETGQISSMGNMVCALAMLCPATAMIITRALTKEGFAFTGEGSMLLGIDLKNRKWLFYVLAMVLPWVYVELGALITLVLSPEAFNSQLPQIYGLGKVVYIQPLAAILSGVLVSFGALGEEAGWRGYMMPKFIKLMGVKKAVVIGGILWGIWHWPMTYVGHNFGIEYWGYPFTGFAAMAVDCTLIGIILTYITYKSNSVWPAVILHAVNNACPSILSFFIDLEKLTGLKADSVVAFFIRCIPTLILGIIFLVKFCRFEKQCQCYC